MLRDDSKDTNAAVTVDDESGAPADWHAIDRGLRAIAKRRGALDAEEAKLLVIAARDEIWRELGKASLLEYLEETLGYSPRAAQERIRVAVALDELPELAEALESGELPFSAVRELTRVAAPETQREWRDFARDKNLRQIEHAVAGRQRGDLPTDPANPDLRPQVVRFEVRPATLVLLRQVQQMLANERGARLDDDELVAAMCTSVLEGSNRASATDAEGSTESGRAKFQIMTGRCESCSAAWQEGAGARLAIDEADLARAECDAQRVGSDAAPRRATQDVPPKTQRFVRRRDGGKCCVPSCRAARHLEIHHIVAREDGGSHEAENLTLLCDGHHRALHEGKLTISGKAPAIVVTWKHREQQKGSTDVAGDTDTSEVRSTHVGEGRAHSTPATSARVSKFALVAMKIEAKQALVQAGYKRHQATAALEIAMQGKETTTLEGLLREALRCMRPDQRRG